LLFNFAFVYVIRKVQEKQKDLKLNGTHQLPVYADNVNIYSGKHTYILLKNTETIMVASNETDQKEHADNT
jgi:hypothetical protein